MTQVATTMPATQLRELNAVEVFTIDPHNVILALRDTGEYKGRSYDKYRLQQWYYSERSKAWQAGSSCPVPWGRKGDFLGALVKLATAEMGTKPARRTKVTANNGGGDTQVTTHID